MTIQFACERCGKRFEVAAANAGRRGRCGRCQQEFIVPAPPQFEAGAALAETEVEQALQPVPSAGPPADVYALEQTVDGMPTAFSPPPGLGEHEMEPDRPRARPRKKKTKNIVADRLAAVEPGQFAHLRKPLIVLGTTLGIFFLLSLVIPALAVWTGIVFTVAGAFCLLVGMVLGAYIAFTEDFVHGFFFVVVPLYAAYYMVSRWDDMKVPLAAVAIGVALATVGGWALEWGGRPLPPDEDAAAPTRRPALARLIEPTQPRILIRSAG